MKTLIRAETLIAYQQGEHRLLPEGELVFEDDSIIFVGRNYPEPVDRILDASSQLVIPGLINLHFHATTEAGGRLIVDQGRKDFFQTGYLNYLTAPPDKVPLGARETATVGGLFALVELIHSGCTTLVEFGAGSDELVEIAGGLGVRAYLGPGYQSAFQRLSPQGHLYYEWDHERGQQGLEQAVRFVHKHQGSYSDRIRCLLSPWQADTVDPELLKQTCQASDDLGVGIQIHTGQNLVEFHEILRRTGLTPVEYLHQQGMLKPGTLLSHCLLTSAHPLAGIPASDDLSILADTGASIAHCPLVFARRGNALFSFHLMRFYFAYTHYMRKKLRIE
jgi:cytosine/adenosine deaminase-related metal-dependent hydrolase